MQINRASLLASLAILGSGLIPTVSVPSNAAELRGAQVITRSHAGLPANVTGLRTAHAISGGFHARAWWRYPRPGHTVRQGQRLARKRRNVQRVRRAARG